MTFECMFALFNVSIYASAREATSLSYLLLLARYVSIHASAREATVLPGFSPKHLPVSIHASAREATGLSIIANFRTLFQSTPPHGRRRHPEGLVGEDLLVSIHASAREATRQSQAIQLSPTFQSTPPHGRRPCLLESADWPFGFQSTPPYGRRRDNLNNGVVSFGVSIHASAREAKSTIFHMEVVGSFQSTPPHGRRPNELRAKSASARSFNPRLRTGGDT